MKWAFTSESMKRLMRLKHLSYRTEQTYLHWLRDFYVFIKPAAALQTGGRALKTLSHLSCGGSHVAKSTQNLAFNALLFFYRHVIEKEVGPLSDVIRSRRGQRLPTVLTIAEVTRLFDAMEGRNRLMAQVLYGGGLRLKECVRLRIKDIDFENNTLMIRGAKGDKDRMTMFPEKIRPDLEVQINNSSLIYDGDRKKDVPGGLPTGCLG